MSSDAAGRRLPYAFFTVAALVYVGAAAVVRAIPGSADGPLLALALSVDLTLLVPGLYYWLAVRRKGWPAATTIPVFLLSLFAASRIVPADHHGFLESLHLLVPLAELAFLALLAVAVRRAFAKAGRGSSAAADPLAQSERITLDLTGSPTAARIVAFELALLTYAFTWRRPAPLGPRELSYHRKAAVGAINGGLLVLIAAEAFPVHLLLSRWSPTAAWVVLALTVYSALWLVGDARAMARRPIRVTGEGLELRFGLRWSLEAPWAAIQELGPRRMGSKADLSLVPLGTDPTHRLVLREPLPARGLYGITRSVSSVDLYVDEPVELVRACSFFLSAAAHPEAATGETAS